MKDNEWVSVQESLPGIGKKVKVKNNLGVIVKAYIRINIEGEYEFVNEDGFVFYAVSVKEWQYIPEKRPDFSKLRNADFIFLEFKSGRKSSAFFDCIAQEEYMILRVSTSSIATMEESLKEIKKITRINLEEQTFEEI